MLGFLFGAIEFVGEVLTFTAHGDEWDGRRRRGRRRCPTCRAKGTLHRPPVSPPRTAQSLWVCSNCKAQSHDGGLWPN